MITTTEECFSCGTETDDFDVICVDPGDRECPPEFAPVCTNCSGAADDARIERAEFERDYGEGPDWL